MQDLSHIETIVVVMMENRSFDHLLGYLSLDSYGWEVDGLKSDLRWNKDVANPYRNLMFQPHRLSDPFRPLDADPPHERQPIANQLAAGEDGSFAMNGFVANYASVRGAASLSTSKPPPVMGYFTGAEAPVTNFFAENFAICDRWFCSLPAGTQPNRLMAMSGFSKIDLNTVPLPDQELVYDWLTKNGVRWRVYHAGIPFFAMMPRWIPEVLASDHFRPFERLFVDWEQEPPARFPQVVFVEPTYTDCPHLGASDDDHAPSAINGGQKFLLEVYRDVTRNPDRWASTVLIVTYDEHGGFFDHVPPPTIPTFPPPDASYRPFVSLGVRVPAFVISPFVQAKTTFSGLLDHTSILKFLGQRFGKDARYSDVVDARPVGSVADLLMGPAFKREIPTIPSLDDYLSKETAPVGFVPGTAPETPMHRAFQSALNAIHDSDGGPSDKFKRLLEAFPKQGIRKS